MPLYEYACTACQHEFEEIQSVSANTAPPCPRCGAAETKRLLSCHSLKTGASPLDHLPKMPIVTGMGRRSGGCGGSSGG
jgi:putative FmdB family regulatory protein